MLKHVVIAAFTFAIVACTESKPTEAAGGAAAPAGDKPAAAAAAAPAGGGLKLPALGLTIDLPADSSVNEMLGSFMVQGGGTVVSVSEVKADNTAAAKTFEDAKKAMGDYSPKKTTKEEKTADGWNIQFQNDGGMGANYFVWVRRTIDGKQIQCETTASSTEQADKAAAACASLKKG